MTNWFLSHTTHWSSFNPQLPSPLSQVCLVHQSVSEFSFEWSACQSVSKHHLQKRKPRGSDWWVYSLLSRNPSTQITDNRQHRFYFLSLYSKQEREVLPKQKNVCTQVFRVEFTPLPTLYSTHKLIVIREGPGVTHVYDKRIHICESPSPNTLIKLPGDRIHSSSIYRTISHDPTVVCHPACRW
jgi:hypothetical protein